LTMGEGEEGMEGLYERKEKDGDGEKGSVTDPGKEEGNEVNKVKAGADLEAKPSFSKSCTIVEMITAPLTHWIWTASFVFTLGLPLCNASQHQNQM
jgi:hypothetical protein